MKLIRKYTFAVITIVLLAFTTAASAAGNTLHLEIKGAEGPVLANVTLRLEVLEKTYGPVLTDKSIEAFVAASPKNIAEAVEPFGYFKSHTHFWLTRRGDDWTAHFVIHLGPELKVAQVALRLTGPGKENPVLQKFIANFPIKAGQIFRADEYESEKEKLFQAAAEQGYLKAFFEDKVISIDLKKYDAVIVIHLNTGPRYYFGKVKFEQNYFRDSFLQRFQHFQPGEPYSSSKLLTLQQNLNDSHYFDEVNVTPDLQTNDEGFEVPVDVRLKPNKPEVYNAGIGYGTYTGARFTAGTEFRHLTSTGHHFKAQVKVSSILSSLSAQYIIPGKDPLNDQYTIGANIQKFAPKNGNSNSKSFFVSTTKKIHDWKHVVTLSYLRENYFIDGDASSHNSRLLIPSYNLTRVESDNPININQGYRMSFDLRGASQYVVSNTNFLQTEIKGKYIFSPTTSSHVVVRGDLGYTVVKDLNLLPLSLQFFAGGLDSVRGFPISYFGPGRYLKTGSVELQHRIYENWSGAVFYDVGVADDHFNASPGQGVGLGLIYNSIIGPVKVYAGYGFLHDKSHHTDIEFSIGPEL